MLIDRLARDLYSEISRIPLIDPHSHINPHAAASRSLDDILGYHYYTELAHSAGMGQEQLSSDTAPRERVRAILAHMDRFDNTVQYGWFLDIARSFLGFKGERITSLDWTALIDQAEQAMGQAGWEGEVLRLSNVEKVFLTNDFDDPLEGFDTTRYVPCLRTDDLVFRLDQPAVRERLAKATAVEIGDVASLRQAVRKLFEHFTSRGAKACAISLPPDFAPVAVADTDLNLALRTSQAQPRLGQGLFSAVQTVRHLAGSDPAAKFATPQAAEAAGVFWMLAEHCREFRLPFDLMIGVNRRVYPGGVHQGQDLFDQRTSLIQYADLFNAFPEVPFCVSVLSSNQNQELVSYSWIFPNVYTSGHWWYSNIPATIAADCRARLQAVPKTKQIGYYSDAYKLEFIRPKYDMYRRILAQLLADDFVRTGVYSETLAVDFARLLLRENARHIFNV
jgi:glucuronate isomerase